MEQAEHFELFPNVYSAFVTGIVRLVLFCSADRQVPTLIFLIDYKIILVCVTLLLGEEYEVWLGHGFFLKVICLSLLQIYQSLIGCGCNLGSGSEGKT